MKGLYMAGRRAMNLLRTERTMAKKQIGTIALVGAVALAILGGCTEFGKVDQGRVIKFDGEKRQCTIIRDASLDPQNPDYSLLPPVVYDLPSDPKEMGAEPKAGLRMKLDPQNKTITIFDEASQNLKTIAYTVIEQKDNVDKEDPLVFDKAAKQPKPFPVVDRDKKTITVFSKRQKVLVTFTLPEEYFTRPDYTWDAGDEVRIYYKQAGVASRLMNVSKTDIFKK